MSIQHIIATLRYANLAFLTGTISKHEAKIALDCAIQDYESCSSSASDKDKKCIDILSKNLTEALEECA
jgi:hypothetical protein